MDQSISKIIAEHRVAVTKTDGGELMRCLGCGISKPTQDFDKPHRRGATFKARCRTCGPVGTSPKFQRCRRCRVTRPVTEFPRLRQKGGGRQLSCIRCVIPRERNSGTKSSSGETSTTGAGTGSSMRLLTDVIALLLTVVRGDAK